MRCITIEVEVWSPLFLYTLSQVFYRFNVKVGWASPSSQAPWWPSPLLQAEAGALPLLALLSQRTSVSAWLINLCLNGIAVGRKAAMPKWNNHLDLNLSCFPS